MKMRMPWVTVLMMVACCLLPIQAQEEDGKEKGEPKEESGRRMEVKRYFGVGPDLVSDAIARDLKRDVRFSDTYEEVQSPPQSLRRITVEGERYRIAAMIRTGSGLYCLVPEDQEESLSELRQSDRISEGQEITIEAMTLGRSSGRNMLLLDRIIVGEEVESRIEHEVVLRWPNAGADPIRITEPGEHSVSFPCRYAEDEEATLRVIVKEEDRDEFLSEIEEEEKNDTEEGSEEGSGDDGEDDEKQYRNFEAQGVYKKIRGNNRLDVQFEDRIKGPSRGVPDRIQIPGGQRLRIGAAFDTYGDVTCLIPAEKEDMVDLVEQIIPGQDVRVWGATLPPVGRYKPLLVDKVELPGIVEPKSNPNVWDVTVLWDDGEAVQFYKLGTYELDFPCQHEDGREEGLIVDLREVRVIPQD